MAVFLACKAKKAAIVDVSVHRCRRRRRHRIHGRRELLSLSCVGGGMRIGFHDSISL